MKTQEEKQTRIELYYIETAINRFKDYWVKKHFSEEILLKQ